MKLNDYPYLIIPEITQNIEENVKQLLCCNGKYKTYEHVCNVAEENVKIAEIYGLNIEKCFMGGLLHDISAVIKPDDMRPNTIWHYSSLTNWRGIKREFPHFMMT